MMNWPGMGVRGKFVVALVMAAALPLLVGVIVLHTVGFRYLMGERGRLDAAEARILSGLLEQAVEARAAGFRSWIAADRSLLEYAAQGSELQSRRDAAERAAETRALDAAWAGLGENEEPVAGCWTIPEQGVCFPSRITIRWWPRFW